MRKKTLKKYTYMGLSFPIELYDVEMIQIENEWHPKVDVKKIADSAIKSLVTQECRLTGTQIKFIRSYFRMSLRDFGKVVNESHTAVQKWENFKDKQTNMDVNIEIMLRLYVFNRIFKITKENKIEFYNNYVQIKNALYKHPEAALA